MREDITTPDAATRLSDRLLGTCDQIEAACEQLRLDIDEDDAHEMLAEANIERCSECDWWVESGELADEDGELVSCSGCRPRE